MHMCHDETLGGDLVIILVLGRSLVIAPLCLVLGGALRRCACPVVLLLTLFHSDEGVHQVYLRSDEKYWSKSDGRGRCATPMELSSSSAALNSAAEVLAIFALWFGRTLRLLRASREGRSGVR